jgi:hypothetical protein
MNLGALGDSFLICCAVIWPVLITCLLLLRTGGNPQRKRGEDK